MDRIEFGELQIGETARAHLNDVCDTNWASMGPKVKAFEKGWSDLFGYTDSIAVSSGTDACVNACLALYDITDASRGDEVIVPALSFIATSNAVRMAGLTPVFVDIEKAEHIGSMFTFRTVLPNRDKDDARQTLVGKVDDKTFTLFSGKIGTCVTAANDILEFI